MWNKIKSALCSQGADGFLLGSFLVFLVIDAKSLDYVWVLIDGVLIIVSINNLLRDDYAKS